MSLVKSNWHEASLSVNGVRLHYVTCGEGPLMLLLHGFPEFWYSWRYQIPEFANDFKVVALDLRGYNESDKPQSVEAYQMEELLQDIKGVIESLGYQNCILVGHDWGGAIVWNFAYRYPGMVTRLIVMNLPHPAKFKEGLTSLPQMLKSWYLLFFQLPFLPELILAANNCQLIASIFTDTSKNREAFTPEDLSAYREAAGKPGALTAMLNYYRSNVQSLLDKKQNSWTVLQIPTLMIWGEDDVALGKEMTYGTSAYVAQLEIKYIRDCSHWVQQEQPNLVNHYMREFLYKSFENQSVGS